VRITVDGSIVALVTRVVKQVVRTRTRRAKRSARDSHTRALGASLSSRKRPVVFMPRPQSAPVNRTPVVCEQESSVGANVRRAIPRPQSAVPLQPQPVRRVIIPMPSVPSQPVPQAARKLPTSSGPPRGADTDHGHGKPPLPATPGVSTLASRTRRVLYMPKPKVALVEAPDEEHPNSAGTPSHGHTAPQQQHQQHHQHQQRSPHRSHQRPASAKPVLRPAARHPDAPRKQTEEFADTGTGTLATPGAVHRARPASAPRSRRLIHSAHHTSLAGGAGPQQASQPAKPERRGTRHPRPHSRCRTRPASAVVASSLPFASPYANDVRPVSAPRKRRPGAQAPHPSPYAQVRRLKLKKRVDAVRREATRVLATRSGTVWGAHVAEFVQQGRSADARSAVVREPCAGTGDGRTASSGVHLQRHAGAGRSNSAGPRRVAVPPALVRASASVCAMEATDRLEAAVQNVPQKLHRALQVR